MCGSGSRLMMRPWLLLLTNDSAKSHGRPGPQRHVARNEIHGPRQSLHDVPAPGVDIGPGHGFRRNRGLVAVGRESLMEAGGRRAEGERILAQRLCAVRRLPEQRDDVAPPVALLSIQSCSTPRVAGSPRADT